MKYYISALFFILLLNLTNAQVNTETDKKELRHGIQFQVGGLLDLRNFNNYTFSYRHLINNNSGFRIGIFTNISELNYDMVQQVDTLISNPPQYENSYRFKISAQYLFSIISYDSFDLILGGGPFFLYSKGDYYSEYLGLNYTNKSEMKSTSTGFGLDLILGVEYKLIKNVILSGEYGMAITKENSEFDFSSVEDYLNGASSRIRKSNGESDSFSLRGMNVNLGLSVFF
jgi:hypothetical protein